MPIDVRSVSATASGDTNDTDLTVDAPAGVTDGDLLVAVVGRSATSSGVTEFTAPGWSEAGFIVADSPSFAVLGVLTLAAGGSEPADYTFTADAPPDGADQFSVHVLCLTGADTTDPVVVVPEFLDAPSISSTARAPSIDIPSGLSDDALLVTHHTVQHFATDNPSFTAPPGMDPASNESDVWLHSLTATELVGSGATGDRDATFEVTPDEHPPRCLSLAIRPASTGEPAVDIVLRPARAVARASRPLLELVPELILRPARAVARASRPLLFAGLGVRRARAAARASRPLLEQQHPDLILRPARAAARATAPLIESPPGAPVCAPTGVAVAPRTGRVAVNTGGKVRVEPMPATVMITCEES